MCGKKSCRTGELDEAPLNCPSLEKDDVEKIKELYLDEENRKLAYNSALYGVGGVFEKNKA
jgi:hypothetical protein